MLWAVTLVHMIDLSTILLVYCVKIRETNKKKRLKTMCLPIYLYTIRTFPNLYIPNKKRINTIHYTCPYHLCANVLICVLRATLVKYRLIIVY